MKEVANRQYITFPRTKWYWQIIVGIACAFLNVALNNFSRTVNLHLFLDSLFTIFASCIGWLSGFTCCFIYHVVILLYLNHPLVDMFWGICGFTIWILVRLFLQKIHQVGFIELLFFTLVLTLTISLEGGILSSIMITNFNFQEDEEVMNFLVGLMRQQIPLLLGAIVARIPLNFLDKGISVFAAWGLFCGYRKFNKEFPRAILFRSQD